MGTGQIDEIVEEDYWKTRDCELTINSIMLIAEVKAITLSLMITIMTQSKMMTMMTQSKRMMMKDN